MSTEDPTCEEIWRPIPDHPNYEVSSLGNVRGYKGAGGSLRPKKLHRNEYGYWKVNLWNDGQYQTVLVHRLVAAAFITPLLDHSVVNHKDRCPTNNHVGNLEVVGHGDNVLHWRIYEWVQLAVKEEFREIRELLEKLHEALAKH